METQTILTYDGSFDGFLSCIFATYEQKIKFPHIVKNSENTGELFSETIAISTEVEKSHRVWKSFKNKTNPAMCRDFFKAFLSEIKGVENTLYLVTKSTLTNKCVLKERNYSDKDILKISQVAKMVGREKHRMEAFVRFQLTKDGFYMATVAPDFNVLPLIIPHFKDRYADQKWLIYDSKRDFGIFYDLQTVEYTSVDFFSKIQTTIASENLAIHEIEFQNLWSSYYHSVNIKSRKNTKLHLQHIPKRYWKYLTEKAPF